MCHQGEDQTVLEVLPSKHTDCGLLATDRRGCCVFPDVPGSGVLHRTWCPRCNGWNDMKVNGSSDGDSPVVM